MPPLTVVIPTYDTASMTLHCCEAVAASMPSAEVIVVDDASRDDTTVRIAHALPGARVIRRSINGGFSAAANDGVAAASADLILLLNSDAVVQKGALQAMVDAFAADPQLGVAGARLLNEDGSPQWSGGRTPTLAWMIGVVSGLGPLAGHFRRRKPGVPPRQVDWVSGAAMMFRRAVWSEAGPLSERYRFYCQDLEFCLAARAAGWDVRVIGDASVVHGHGATIAGASELRYDPGSSWPDLVTWGRLHYGTRWAFAARVALIAIGALRASMRALIRRDETTRALWRGVGELRRAESQRISDS